MRKFGLFTLYSVGSKVLMGFLLWRGMPISWASILIALLIMPYAIKLLRAGRSENIYCDREAQGERLRSDDIAWVSEHPNREAYIKGSPMASTQPRLPVTRGASSARSLTVSSASARATSLMRFAFRPHTPALITTAQPRSDGVSQ